ncbi:unnamed protein product [Caenorhabditis nigoni]
MPHVEFWSIVDYVFLLKKKEALEAIKNFHPKLTTGQFLEQLEMFLESLETGNSTSSTKFGLQERDRKDSIEILKMSSSDKLDGEKSVEVPKATKRRSNYDISFKSSVVSSNNSPRRFRRLFDSLFQNKLGSSKWIGCIEKKRLERSLEELEDLIEEVDLSEEEYQEDSDSSLIFD